VHTVYWLTTGLGHRNNRSDPDSIRLLFFNVYLGTSTSAVLVLGLVFSVS